MLIKPVSTSLFVFLTLGYEGLFFLIVLTFVLEGVSLVKKTRGLSQYKKVLTNS